MKSLVDEQEKILPIGAIEKALNINKSKLLQYEEKGVVMPDRTNGKPLYSLDDLDKLRQII